MSQLDAIAQQLRPTYVVLLIINEVVVLLIINEVVVGGKRCFFFFFFTQLKVNLSLDDICSNPPIGTPIRARTRHMESEPKKRHATSALFRNSLYRNSTLLSLPKDAGGPCGASPLPSPSAIINGRRFGHEVRKRAFFLSLK